MPKPTPEPTRAYRYPLMERILLGSTAVLIWALLLGGLGLVMSLIPGPEWMLGAFLFAVLALFTLLANIVVRDFLMKLNWRLTLEDEAVTLHLPAHRLLFGREPAFSATLPFADIKGIEWREESTETFDVETVNHVYALRLHDGRVLMLGEDRPIPRTDDRTTQMAEAARALAKALATPVRRLPGVNGDAGFLTLWGASRPPWPKTDDQALTGADAHALRNRQIVTNLIPGIAFAGILAASALSKLGG